MKCQTRSSGFHFPADPFCWQDSDDENAIVSNPIIRIHTDRQTCDHCGADVPCKYVGPDNGQKFWLCNVCAKKRLMRERYYFGLPRGIDR